MDRHGAPMRALIDQVAASMQEAAEPPSGAGWVPGLAVRDPRRGQALADALRAVDGTAKPVDKVLHEIEKAQEVLRVYGPKALRRGASDRIMSEAAGLLMAAHDAVRKVQALLSDVSNKLHDAGDAAMAKD